jgi:hypothetical protein
MRILPYAALVIALALCAGSFTSPISAACAQLLASSIFLASLAAVAFAQLPDPGRERADSSGIRQDDLIFGREPTRVGPSQHSPNPHRPQHDREGCERALR